MSKEELNLAMGRVPKIGKGGNRKLFTLAYWGMLSVGMVIGSPHRLLVPISDACIPGQDKRGVRHLRQLQHVSFLAQHNGGMVKDQVPIILFIVLSGLSLSWFYPSMIALGANTFPKHIGFMTGALAAGGTSGSILFPWLIGPVSEALGLGRIVFIVPLLCLGLAGIFCYYALSSAHSKASNGGLPPRH